MDLNSVGCLFTWMNSHVWSKLDHAMVNAAQDTNLGNTHVLFPPPECMSDHSPCIVTIEKPMGRMRRPFKYFSMWPDHDQFFPTLESTGS